MGRKLVLRQDRQLCCTQGSEKDKPEFHLRHRLLGRLVC